jgi:hypothetical protein
MLHVTHRAWHGCIILQIEKCHTDKLQLAVLSSYVTDNWVWCNTRKTACGNEQPYNQLQNKASPRDLVTGEHAFGHEQCR